MKRAFGSSRRSNIEVRLEIRCPIIGSNVPNGGRFRYTWRRPPDCFEVSWMAASGICVLIVSNGVSNRTEGGEARSKKHWLPTGKVLRPSSLPPSLMLHDIGLSKWS
jgi:hypothetical protein